MWSQISVIVRTSFVAIAVLGMTLLAVPTFRSEIQAFVEKHVSIQPGEENIVWRSVPDKERKSVTERSMPDDAAPQVINPKRQQAITPVKLSPPIPPGRTDNEESHQLSLRRQLLALGATNLKLIVPSPAHEQYQFVCELPLGDRSVYRRRFSAESHSGSTAMQRVYEEATRWREECRIASRFASTP